MADFTALKAAIQAAIRQNGNNEITGNIMQGILLSMVNTIGDASIIPLMDAVVALSTRIANEFIQLGVPETVNINNIGSGVLSFTSASVPSGLPSIDYGDGAVIFTIRQNETNLSDFDRQFLITKNAIYTRVYYGSAWQIWKGTDITNEVIQLGLKTEAFAVDNLKSGIYSFIAPTGASLGIPDLDYGDGGQLSVFRQNNDSLSDWDRQVLTSNMKPNFVYTRTYYNNAWGIWKLYKSPVPREVIELGVKTSAFSIDNLASGIYDFTAPTGANLGFPDLDYGDGGQLSVFRQSDDSLSDFDRQMLVSNMKPGIVYTRVYVGNAWGNWKSYSYEPDAIECGAGKQYTTLRAAVNAAIQKKGTTVIVYPGTYDLTQEFATELANHSGSGILLANDVHLKFLAGAYVTCLVDVSNTWAYANFEPFRVDAGDANTNFTIEGINIKCKNTRYCVHDEYFGADVKYIHKYINCHMEQTDENQLAHYHQCIGIGLGKNGTIIVDGGYYKSYSLYYEPHYTSADDMQQPITAHNGNNANCDGRIFIKDVYLADKGYLRFGNYGSSTILTPVEVCGCRMYKPIMLMNETWDSQQVTNFEIIAFNNEIITQ